MALIHVLDIFLHVCDDTVSFLRDVQLEQTGLVVQRTECAFNFVTLTDPQPTMVEAAFGL